MHSIFFTGRLAAAPELTNHASGKVCKIRAISNEFIGKNDNGDNREEALSVQWTCFDGRAEAIGKHMFKGDEIKIIGHMRNNNYIPKGGTEADTKYEMQFYIDSFEFGAPGPEKRAMLEAQRG